MFDRICVRPSKGQSPASIDLGLLTEAMLFYDRVELVINRGVLDQLLEAVGPADLVRLAESGLLSITHANKSTAVLTNDTGSTREKYAVTVFEIPDLYLTPSRITDTFRAAVGKSGRGRRLADRFAEHVNYWEPDDQFASRWTTELLDRQEIEREIRIVLAGVAPGYQLPDPLVFDAVHVPDSEVDGSPRFAIETNLDLSAIERAMTAVDAIKPLTVAHLLSWMASAREDLLFGSHFNAELAVDPMTSELVARLVDGAMAERDISVDAIGRFQDFTLGDARAIREAINTGAKSFAEALSVLESGRRFRHWLADQPPNADLLKEYFRASTESTWIERLPAKTLRWLLVTGGGAAAGTLLAPGPGTIVGASLGTADFITSALSSGWRPNQFVEGKLQSMSPIDPEARPQG